MKEIFSYNPLTDPKHIQQGFVRVVLRRGKYHADTVRDGDILRAVIGKAFGLTVADYDRALRELSEFGFGIEQELV